MKFVVSILLLAIVMVSCLMALSVSAAASTQPNLDQGCGSLAVSHVDAAAYRLRADAGDGSYRERRLDQELRRHQHGRCRDLDLCGQRRPVLCDPHVCDCSRKEKQRQITRVNNLGVSNGSIVHKDGKICQHKKNVQNNLLKVQ